VDQEFPAFKKSAPIGAQLQRNPAHSPARQHG
jgi:hypothetical protein